MREKFDPVLTSQLPQSVTGLRPITRKDSEWDQVAGGQGPNANTLSLYRDDQGRNWHRIAEDRWGPGQMLFARIFKSVIPVCDVIKSDLTQGKGSPYLSLVSDPVDIQERFSPAKLRAIRIAFRAVFKDMDRASRTNMVGDDEKFLFFDFETIPIFFMNPTTIDRTDDFFTSRMKGMMERNRGLTYWEDMLQRLTLSSLQDMMISFGGAESQQSINETLNELVSLLSNLQRHIDDKESIQKIVTSIGVPLSKVMSFSPVEGMSEDQLFRLFYFALSSRINDALRLVTKVRDASVN